MKWKAIDNEEYQRVKIIVCCKALFKNLGILQQQKEGGLNVIW
jgi:hypothetical protein